MRLVPSLSRRNPRLQFVRACAGLVQVLSGAVLLVDVEGAAEHVAVAEAKLAAAVADVDTLLPAHVVVLVDRRQLARFGVDVLHAGTPGGPRRPPFGTPAAISRAEAPDRAANEGGGPRCHVNRRGAHSASSVHRQPDPSARPAQVPLGPFVEGLPRRGRGRRVRVVGLRPVLVAVVVVASLDAHLEAGKASGTS